MLHSDKMWIILRLYIQFSQVYAQNLCRMFLFPKNSIRWISKQYKEVQEISFLWYHFYEDYDFGSMIKLNHK